MNQKLNIAFWGTPALCTTILDSLHQNGFLPSLVVTNPDKPVGRNWSELQASPVKEWGQAHNISVFQPEHLDDEAYTYLTRQPWDLFIVVAYGVIMPERFIHIPKHGTLNIHYSLLPLWRGATPVEAAILAGDHETGVSIQKMQYKLDSGPIIASASLPITHHEYTLELREKLTHIGAQLLVETLPCWIAGEITPIEQDVSQVTKCGLTKKEDGLIILNEPDEILWRKYRAYYGWPGLYFFDDNGKRVKIIEADYINKKFIIKKVIPEGKKEQEWRN